MIGGRLSQPIIIHCYPCMREICNKHHQSPGQSWGPIFRKCMSLGLLLPVRHKNPVLFCLGRFLLRSVYKHRLWNLKKQLFNFFIIQYYIKLHVVSFYIIKYFYKIKKRLKKFPNFSLCVHRERQQGRSSVMTRIEK